MTQHVPAPRGLLAWGVGTAGGTSGAPQVSDLTTSLMALYGAILATAVAVWNAWTYVSDRRPRIRLSRLQFTQSYATTSYYPDRGSARIVADISNVGHVPVVISEAVLVESSGCRQTMVEGRMIPLAVGGVATASIPGTYANDPNALRIEVSLGTGQTFVSTPFSWSRDVGLVDGVRFKRKARLAR